MPANAQTFKAWLKAGDEAFEQARYAEAIEFYAKALEFETGNVTLDYRMAETCRLYKDYKRAEAWYAKVWGSDVSSNYPLALFYLAEMKKYNGDYENACRLFGEFDKKNPSDSSYEGLKSRVEFGYCEEVIALNQVEAKVTVTNAGSEINSKFSDFGSSISGDSVMYYSSLRFQFEPKDKKDQPYFVTRILKLEQNGKGSKKPSALGSMINEPPIHNANSGFSPDQKLVVFSRCEKESSTGKMICKLFFSRLTNGKWSKPEVIKGEVNAPPPFTTTQPSIEANGALGYTLYFASDRLGGFGKMDIWKCDIDASMNFSNPTNLGATINTFDDEMTPYFDTRNSNLYFSSYGHAGLGGMDIFKSNKTNESFSKPINLGKGFNSSQNDVYFTINNHNENGTLSSNREGSQFIGSKTCCYDIYLYEPKQLDTALAVVIEEKIDSLSINDPGKKEYYDDFLPLSLYFDNDEPDKRTLAVTTKKNYEKLYQDYLARIPEYKSNFASGSKNIAAAEAEIDSFFANTVTRSWNMLNGFCAKVEKAMLAGVVLELEIRGRASPLAETAYNINLSRRRISSLLNYMTNYNGGILKPFFESGKLKLTEVPAGESLAKTNVSDNREDVRNSIYNPAAASERLIELIGVKINAPSTPTLDE
jgi:tetratricopeptide (TPR) repeat protein